MPLGLITTFQTPEGTENKTYARLRRLYVVVAVFSLVSELITVMWATVAVNQ